MPRSRKWEHSLAGHHPTRDVKVRIAFQTLEDDETIPPTYQEIQCHMVWDVKMEDFRRKERFVAGRHMTETPALNTYASVVSRESGRIAFDFGCSE
jgi:hypothetical protein